MIRKLDIILRNPNLINILLPFTVIVIAVLPVTGFIKSNWLKHFLQAVAALLLLFGFIHRHLSSKKYK